MEDPSGEVEEEHWFGEKGHHESNEMESRHHYKEANSGIFTNQRLTRKSEGKAKILQKCKKKWLVKQTRKSFYLFN